METSMTLWLFIVVLGTAFGAGLYESRITIPRWITPDRWDGAAAARDDPGRRFWAFVTTLPLTLLTFVSLAQAWSERSWWLAAAVTALAERLLTFGYFIPTMVRLQKLPDGAEARAKATWWARANYLRHALTLAAWLLAMKALR
jgi:hypothetical protein